MAAAFNGAHGSFALQLRDLVVVSGGQVRNDLLQQGRPRKMILAGPHLFAEVVGESAVVGAANVGVGAGLVVAASRPQNVVHEVLLPQLHSARQPARLAAFHLDECFVRRRRDEPRLAIHHQVERFQTGAGVAGVQIDLQQHVGRQGGEQVMEFVIHDHVVQVPVVAGLRQVVRAKGFIRLIRLIAVCVRYLGSVAGHTEHEIAQVSLLLRRPPSISVYS